MPYAISRYAICDMRYGAWPPQLSTTGRELLQEAGLPEGMPQSRMTVASSITKQALQKCSFILALKLFYREAAMFIESQTMVHIT